MIHSQQNAGGLNAPLLCGAQNCRSNDRRCEFAAGFLGEWGMGNGERKNSPKKSAHIGAEFTMSENNVDLYRIDVAKRPICDKCGLVLLAGAADWYCLQCDDPIFYIRIDRTSTKKPDLEADI